MDKTQKAKEAIQKAQSGNTAQKKVERAVAKAAAETISEKRNSKTPAQDTDEFIEKYYKKRFSPATAGKAYLLSFLFDVYNGQKEIIKGRLWNIELLKEKITTEEDMRSFDAYYHLTEWLRNLYENSRTVRNSLQSFIWSLDHIAGTVLSAETIRRTAIKDNPDLLLTLLINTTSLENYIPEADGRYAVINIRDNIEEGLRYLVAYHAFIDVIAEYTGIPECEVLKVKQINSLLSALNETLSMLRKDIKEHREPEAQSNPASDNPIADQLELPPPLNTLYPPILLSWDQERLDVALEVFAPVKEAPPIPKDRIDYLRENIQREFRTGMLNWYVLYTRYSVKYRDPIEVVLPVYHRRGREITLTEEGE